MSNKLDFFLGLTNAERNAFCLQLCNTSLLKRMIKESDKKNMPPIIKKFMEADYIMPFRDLVEKFIPTLEKELKIGLMINKYYADKQKQFSIIIIIK